MIYLYVYLFVCSILLIFVFLKDREFFNFIFNGIEIANEYKKATYFFSFLFVTLLLILMITIVLLLSPLILIRYIPRNYKEQLNDISYLKKVKRHSVPLYPELFFSLTETYKPIIPWFSEFEKKYNSSQFVAFPIIYDSYISVNFLFNSNLRTSLDKQGVSLFIFTANEFHDVPLISQNQKYDINFLTSDTNFSFIPQHQDASSAALSFLLNIPMDGKNKMVIVDKKVPNEITILDLNNITEDFLIDNIYDLNDYKIHLEKPFQYYISEYLSIFWSKSKLEVIKDCAKKIKNRLYDHYKVSDPSILNIFKLTERFQEPITRFQMSGYSFEETEIRKIILNKSINEIRQLYPETDEDELKSIKSSELDIKLSAITRIEGLEYESKIFLKSANMVYSMFLLEKDIEEIDYSPVAIGYTKFFEKEINVSVVQSIRKELGVPMPIYFNKYYPDQEKYEININNKFKIDYNMKNIKTGNYLAPGLGQTFHALEIEFDKIDGDKKKLNELLYKGRKLNNIRNRAAHPELIGKEDIDEIRDIILSLYLNKIFDELITTKKMLSN